MNTPPPHTSSFTRTALCNALAGLALVLGVIGTSPLHAQDPPPDDTQPDELTEPIPERPPLPPPPPDIPTLPEGIPLSANDALSKALAANPAFARAGVSLRRAQTIARGEEAILSPVFQLGANYTHSDQPTRGLFENGLRISDVTSIQSGLTKRLKWGTDVSLSLDLQRLKSVQPFTLPNGTRDVNILGPQWSQTLALTLRQPLMRGYGERLNELPIEAAREQINAADASRRQTASQLVLDVLTAYYELYYSHTNTKDLRAQRIAALDQRQATDALIRARRLAPVELDVIDQRIIVIDESILVAQNELKSRQDDLLRILGSSNNTPPFSPSTTPKLPSQTNTPLTEKLVQDAIDANPELVLLRQQLKTRQLSLVTAKDATKPQVDLSMTLSQQGLSDAGVLDVTEQVLTLQAGTVTVGVSVALPVDNRRAEAQYEAGVMEVEELRLQILENEQNVRVGVRNAIRLVNVSRQRVDLGQRSVSLAARALEAERARFRAGRSTNQNIIRFEEDLDRARTRLLRARVDLTLARLRLEHLRGTLLPTFSLQLGTP